MPEGEPYGPLVWSPDGRWVAFSRAYDRGTSVWRVNVHTGEVLQVTREAR
jgi:Tol biopolymer transport system component